MYGKDLTGMTFGRLTVISKTDKRFNGSIVWLCRCNNDGNLVNVSSKYLLSGDVKSCGCLKEELLGKTATKHGMSYTRFYSIYRHILTRCYNERCNKYKYYGSRGIRVCERWLNSFENFKEDMQDSYLEHVKEYSEKETTLDRIDVNGNYEPENCRWATYKEQANNTRRCIKKQ